MITQVPKPTKEEKPKLNLSHKPKCNCDNDCVSSGYLKIDNFLAEYSGNPAPVLNNLGIYSKDDIDKILKEMNHLISIVRNENTITITDNDGKVVSFKVLGGNYEYILDHFAEEVVKISRVISEEAISELTPDIADDRITNSGIVENKINSLVPDLAKNELENSGIVERKINELAPGIADTEINNLVPDIAYNKAKEAITDEATGIIKDVALETVTEMTSEIAKDVATEEINAQVPSIAIEKAVEKINELVPEIAQQESTIIADNYVDEYLTWNVIQDDESDNSLDEVNDDTTG